MGKTTRDFRFFTFSHISSSFGISKVHGTQAVLFLTKMANAKDNGRSCKSPWLPLICTLCFLVAIAGGLTWFLSRKDNQVDDIFDFSWHRSEHNLKEGPPSKGHFQFVFMLIAMPVLLCVFGTICY